MSAPDRELEELLEETARALEAGDAMAAAGAVARALERIATGPAPADPERLLLAHARLTSFAERERDRIAAELAELGTSRRAAGAYGENR